MAAATPILLRDDDDKSRLGAVGPNPAAGWRVVGFAGLLVAFIGWTDLALLWWPFKFGDPEWEFGTISGFIDGLPLGTIGLVAVAVAALVRGRGITLRVLGTLFAVIALGVIALGVVYALDLPLAWKAIAEPIRPVLRKAIVKTTLLGLWYVVLYAGLAWTCWKSVLNKKGVGT